MRKWHVERYAAVTTLSRELVERFRNEIEDDDSDVDLVVVHHRGGDDEFRLGEEYCASDDPLDRVTGAEILSQLGGPDQTFHEESIAILTGLLEDSDDEVVRCAGVALGHRSAESAIPALLRRVNDSSSKVRQGVVMGLLGLENERAIEAMIQLSSDDDFDVRNWAVFGLGSMVEVDSAAIRDALRGALNDEDSEIRGEALVGLALRDGSSVVDYLFDEWKRDEISLLSIEAAEESGDPRLCGSLMAIAEDLDLKDDAYFSKRLDNAIAVCRPVTGGELTGSTSDRGKPEE